MDRRAKAKAACLLRNRRSQVRILSGALGGCPATAGGSRFKHDARLSEHADFRDRGAALPGDARRRRRMVAGSALRMLGATVGLLVLYAAVPFGETSGAGTLVRLIVGLVVFVAIVGWQIRTITRSEHPVMRAVEVIALALPLLAVVFAYTYLSLSHAEPASFSEHLNHVDALYFTLTTISTVGFGDIAAKTDAARILVTVQEVLDLAVIAGLLRLVVLATRTGLQRRPPGGGLRDADPEQADG